MLWEVCCIPSLMHGAGTWVEISKAAEKTLNSLQLWFVRLVLRVGQGAPVAALLWDSALLDMGLRVWRDKIMMVLHIRSLGKETLARKIYEEQKEKKWPGLAEESKNICAELGIEDCNSTSMSKTDFRQLVTEACHTKNAARLRSTASEVKCGRIKTEDYGKKDYIESKTIQDSRKWLRTRFGLTDFAGNYQHNQKFAKSSWLCRCRGAVEEEGHIVSGHCDVYADLREQFGDLGEDKNLVDYFQAVLDRREEMEEEDRTQQSLNAAVVASNNLVTSHPRELHPIGLIQL